MRTMNLFVIFSLFLSLQAVASEVNSDTPTPQVITLDDVVKKVSSDNYQILENALRVYQAKESIQVARGNLLPRLNLWRVAGVVMDVVMQNYAGAAMGLIEDVAPFLVPANWFRLKEEKILFFAEKEGYRALWGNVVMTSKALYFHSLLDRAILSHVEKSIAELEELFEIVESREILGGMRDGASREIETRILALEEDKRALEVLINEETSLLAFMMGFPNEVELTLSPVPVPPVEEQKPLDYRDFEFRVVDSAPEIRQYNHFIDASKYVKKEVMYSFLGGSSMSRGMSGGVFDGIPNQMGLGFGTGPSLRMVSAQKEILKTQQKAIAETIRRELKILVANYNLDLANYPSLKRHVFLTNMTLDKLYERLNLGENVEMLALVEASRNHIQAETSFFSVEFRFLANEDKLKRLLFQGDYNKEPAAVELVKKVLK